MLVMISLLHNVSRDQKFSSAYNLSVYQLNTVDRLTTSVASFISNHVSGIYLSDDYIESLFREISITSTQNDENSSKNITSVLQHT